MPRGPAWAESRKHCAAAQAACTGVHATVDLSPHAGPTSTTPLHAVNREETMVATTNEFESVDPATGEVLAAVPEASPADVDEAGDRAQLAFSPDGPWRSLLPAHRARLLWYVGELIEQHADELAQLETRDQGQPLGISRHISVAAAAEHFRYYAGWVTKIAGETNPLSFRGPSSTLSESPSVSAG
jgi:acyl-CoA reductase-like NAD-dependent aldehyde dehydrogenase